MQVVNNTLIQAIEFQQQGKIDEASSLFSKVLAIDPGNAAALYSLSLIAHHSGNNAEALRISERGVNVAPLFSPLHLIHGAVLQAMGRKEEALQSYDKALEINPNYVEVLTNSGVLLRDMLRHREALERFNHILSFDSFNTSALSNCGILLTEFKQSELAIPMFKQLISLNPDYDYALGLLAYEQLHICDWTDFEALSRQITEGIAAGGRSCKSLAFMSFSDSAEDHQRAAKLFSEQYCPKRDISYWQGERYHHKKIRLAYVSPDLREHPVGHLMAGVFERHDKSRFELTAISLGIDDGSRLRTRMLKTFDHFIDAQQMSASQIAQTLREMEIDIAVDLAGYTSDSRADIFAHRPVPVQVNYLGYPGTMGTEYMDYILADRHVIPENQQQFYSEKVVYLPDSYLPTDSGIQIAERTPSREECGLPATGVVFCSFSHDYKILPATFAIWMRLLQQVPGSVLWLMSRRDISIHNLCLAAEQQGIDPARLIFATRVPLVEDHLARYRLADIFLDTHPYNAHTTAADALMAGLPVVTYMGNAFPARVAGSLLHAIGMPELIAQSLEEYEQIALRLVTTPELLADVKARLVANKATCALFDTERFTRNLEAAYIAMWRQAQLGDALDALSSKDSCLIAKAVVSVNDEGRWPVSETQKIKVALETSPNKIYNRIVGELAVGFRNCGYECIVIDSSVVKTKAELLILYNQCDWAIVTNGSGYLSLKWPDVYLFEEITSKIAFLHHDAPFNTRELNDIQEKLDAFVRIKDRSVHFSIEKSDVVDFKKLGIVAHTINHINTLGSVPSANEHVCLRDVAFIGHVVPPILSPIPFGTVDDSNYFNSYLSRVTNLDHRIKDDYSKFEELDLHSKISSSVEIAQKMQYIQQVHLYSQPHRGAVLEKVCGYDLHIYGGDPSWLHGIEQSRFLNNANITYYKPVFEREQVIELFSTTRINVNITSLQFDTAVINRVMDCAASGGFILTDRKAQLYELTSVADEISYGSIEELSSKIDYFMQPEHQKQREEISRQLQQNLEVRCSVDSVVEYMVSVMKLC
jgi:predicted O-linked N-acetylglucosamine transferase (SPINDLY family)